MVKCGDWGCRPNQDWSHINVRHMQAVWQHSYAVDVNMDVSLQHYSRSHWPSFGKSPRNLGNSWATNDGEVQWLIEAVDPIKTDPTSMSDSCKMFGNYYMQWMCIWMCPYIITAALIDQSLGSHLEIWVLPGQQMMVKCSDWGWPSFGKSPRNLGNSCATNDGEVQWLRL